MFKRRTYEIGGLDELDEESTFVHDSTEILRLLLLLLLLKLLLRLRLGVVAVEIIGCQVLMAGINAMILVGLIHVVILVRLRLRSHLIVRRSRCRCLRWLHIILKGKMAQLNRRRATIKGY